MIISGNFQAVYRSRVLVFDIQAVYRSRVLFFGIQAVYRSRVLIFGIQAVYRSRVQIFDIQAVYIIPQKRRFMKPSPKKDVHEALILMTTDAVHVVYWFFLNGWHLFRSQVKA